MLPIGNATDDFDGIRVTCIHKGVPVVLLLAADVGCTGNESPEALDANSVLKAT
jgi:4-oxalomesaconate tautomerase